MRARMPGDRRRRNDRAPASSLRFGLAMDLAPLNRGVLLLVAQTAEGRVCWVERAALALDVRGPETVVHSRDDFRRSLKLRRPPVALDRYAVRALWVENDDDPVMAQAAFERLLAGKCRSN
jgi:hypothetical protein